VNRQLVTVRCDQLASPTATEVIRDVATSDRRTVGGGEVTSIIWEDELLQQALTAIYAKQSYG
jgi:hypothetical protein